jgi:hypothetical protein
VGTSDPQGTDRDLKVYDVERRDEQNNAALIVAVTTGTLAYFTVASAYLADETRQTKLSPNILMLAPFPLLILTGYITFQYAASRVRQSYLMKLEATLSRKSWTENVNFPGYVTLHQGIFAGWKSALWPFAALTILTLLSHVIIVVGFTGYTAFISHREHANDVWFWSLASLYTLMIIVNVAAVIIMLEFTSNPSSKQLINLRKLAAHTVDMEMSRWRRPRSETQVEQHDIATNRTVWGAALIMKWPPLATFAAVCVFTILPIAVLRHATEGHYYDYAWSSIPGDFLIALELALLGWEMRTAGNVARLTTSTVWHASVATLCMAAGVVLYARSDPPQETVANSFHNLVVVPLLSYVVISTTPNLARGKFSLRKMFAVVCLLTWMALFSYDLATGNLQKNNP